MAVAFGDEIVEELEVSDVGEEGQRGCPGSARIVTL
jgi:hypothetical protein